MNTIKRLIVTTFLMLGMLGSTAYADNMKKLGTMNVHYMAISATFLTPEIAKAYNIERSRYNGLVNISVLDNTKTGNPAKTVTITGNAKNLVGQSKPLEFVEVKEGSAIYYLAQVSYHNEETIVFNLTISDGKESHPLEFSQKFYVD
ncbi:hypothetical protein tinsulaeT_03780 [Thalassotalea insulae]|uniref:DUF4426 domain-containing protein n=1 Tax=Thalassotalea insulae TaxID=2056778 RepID=A0ABQ6GM29_9GAMM|nr:DUF4426 domain-containing protein [Thalassotalea insulae]GLX77038.1 hypothetical protein tinsulaeT_03780 [Thalassotalea insulae]